MSKYTVVKFDHDSLEIEVHPYIIDTVDEAKKVVDNWRKEDWPDCHESKWVDRVRCTEVAYCFLWDYDPEDDNHDIEYVIHCLKENE